MSKQLHLSKLNRVLFAETSDLSSDHPNFPCPFCTKIFDEKAEVVVHLDTCDAMILLSVMRKMRAISTTDTTLTIAPCSFCLSMEVQRHKPIGICNVSFMSRNLYEHWEFVETHSQSLVQIQTLFVRFFMLCYTLILTS